MYATCATPTVLSALVAKPSAKQQADKGAHLPDWASWIPANSIKRNHVGQCACVIWMIAIVSELVVANLVEEFHVKALHVVVHVRFVC